MSYDATGRKSSSTSPASRADVNLQIYTDSIIPSLDIERVDMDGTSSFPPKLFDKEAEFAQYVYDNHLLPVFKDQVKFKSCTT
jgi:hypothetical protein